MDSLTSVLNNDIRTLEVEMFDGSRLAHRHNLSDQHLKEAQKLAKKHHALALPSVNGVRLLWESGRFCGAFRRNGWWFSGWYDQSVRAYVCIGYHRQTSHAPSEMVAVRDAWAAGYQAMLPALQWSISSVI